MKLDFGLQDVAVALVSAFVVISGLFYLEGYVLPAAGFMLAAVISGAAAYLEEKE